MLPIWCLHQQILDGILESSENDETTGALLQSHDDGRQIVRKTNKIRAVRMIYTRLLEPIEGNVVPYTYHCINPFLKLVFQYH